MKSARILLYFSIVVSALVPAQAVVAQTAQELSALMPKLQIKAGKGGNLTLGGDFRQSEFNPTAKGFELHLHWNGVDDEDWPFEKILSAIAGRICGSVSQASVSNHIEALYKTRSLIRGRDLGGNAGETFKRRLVTKLGRCDVTYVAEGARWHTLSAIVAKP